MIKKVAKLTVDNATQEQVNVNAIKDIAKLKIELAKLTVQSPKTAALASSSASESNSASGSQLTSGNDSVSQFVSNTKSMEGVNQNV